MDYISGKISKVIALVCTIFMISACTNSKDTSITPNDITFSPITKLDEFSLDGTADASMFGLKNDKFYFETIFNDPTEIMKSDEVYSYDLIKGEVKSLDENTKDIRYRDYMVHKDHKYYTYLEKIKSLREPYKLYVIDEYKGNKKVIAEGHTWNASNAPRFRVVDDTIFFLMESFSPDSAGDYANGSLTFKLISYKDGETSVIEEGSTDLNNYAYTEKVGSSLASTILYDNNYGELLCTYRENGRSVLLHYVDGKWEKKKLSYIIYLNAFHKDQVFYSTERRMCVYNIKTKNNLSLKENHIVLAANGITDKGFLYFTEHENGDRPLNLLQVNGDDYTLESVTTPEGVVAIYMNNKEGIALGADHIYKIEY